MKQYIVWGAGLIGICLFSVISFLIGGRAGYFLLFNPTVSGYHAKSMEFKADAAVYSDIPYGDHMRQILDIYVPEGGDGPFPVLVFFHGGKWISNSKDTFSCIGKPYLENGVIFVSVNYRLAPEYPYPTPVSDCESAVTWVYENIDTYNGDPERIILAGHSAGAHLCAIITVKNGWIEEAGLPEDIITGCVLLSGPTDLRQIRYHEIRSFIPARSLIDEASPVLYVQEGLPPFIIVYGTGDSMVPERIPQDFLEKLREHDVDATGIGLPMRTHLQVLDDFCDRDGFVVPCVLELLTSGGVSADDVSADDTYPEIEHELGEKTDPFQKFLLRILTK